MSDQPRPERESLHEALRLSEAKYWDLFERLPDPAWIFDQETLRFLAVNATAIERYGWTREEFLQLTVMDIRPSEDTGRLKEYFKEFPERREMKGQWRHRTKSGEVFFVEVTSRAIDFRGRSCRLTVVRDVHDRMEALEALKAGEERYRSVIEQSGDMIYLMDLDTKEVVESNPAFRRQLGYADPEGMGLTLYDLVAADRESVDRNVEQVRSEGHHFVGRRQYRHADGSMRDVEVGATALKASGRPLMAVVARDVTEQLRAEAALQQAQRLESLGLLAGGVAHDFNNLLTAMLGNLNLAQHKAGKDSPAAPHLASLEKTLLRAADLTKQMLAYSGKGQFVVKAVDLNQAVEEMAGLFSVSISPKVSLRFDFARALPTVEADPVQLQQVLMNLVANASDAVGEGEGEGMVRIATRLRRLGDGEVADFQGQAIPAGAFVVLEVEDSGCGMAPEVMARIFEPFFSTKDSGRGLGLGAMLGILKGHQASLQIQSEPGRGSTFRIFFPASQQALEPEPSQRSPLMEQPVGLALVVDDEAEIRQAAASLFGLLGFREVLEAGDGEEALEHFRARQGEISLVFMDMTMPRMGGRDTFFAMRGLDPAVKVILTSGYSEQEAFRDFGGEAPFGFLQKPYRFKQLREAVLKAIQAGA